MGEVYRATDSKLGREVAIKILPENVAFVADRRARFEREARTSVPTACCGCPPAERTSLDGRIEPSGRKQEVYREVRTSPDGTKAVVRVSLSTSAS